MNEFKTVSEGEFFAALYGDRRDIMPTTRDPNVTFWEIAATREIFGRTFPGWKDSGNPNAPKRYELKNA